MFTLKHNSKLIVYSIMLSFMIVGLGTALYVPNSTNEPNVETDRPAIEVQTKDEVPKTEPKPSIKEVDTSLTPTLNSSEQGIDDGWERLENPNFAGVGGEG